MARDKTTQANGSRKNVSGGSAGAGGYSYQAEAFAYVGAAILAGSELNWVDAGGSRFPVAILAETGKGGDDLQVHLEGGIVIEVQAKMHVQSGDKLWTALVDLARSVNGSENVYGVLLTDTRASHNVRYDLKNDIARVGQQRTDGLKSITNTFIKKLNAAGIRNVESCCSRLRILTWDFESGSPGEKQIHDLLSRIVLDKGRVRDAHDALSKDGKDIIIQRGRRDRQALVQLFASRGIVLIPESASSHHFQPVLNQMQHLYAALGNVNTAGLEAQERLLAAETKQKISRIRQLIDTHQPKQALEEAHDLERWLTENATQLASALVADAYAALVEVEANDLAREEMSPSRFGKVESLIHHSEDALNRTSSQEAALISQRLFSLKCFIASLRDGADAGLTCLNQHDDPYAIRRRLAILIRAKRFEEALQVVRKEQLHPEWADKAAFVYATTGNPDEASATIEWAIRQIEVPLLPTICAIRAADALWAQIAEFECYSAAYPSEKLSADDRAKLEQARSFLAIVSAAPKALRHVSREQDLWVLKREAMLLAHLGNREALAQVISTLETWRPLPLVLVDLVQHGLWPCGSGWLERFRQEYPDDYGIQLWVSVNENEVEEQEPARYQEAFDRLFDLAQRAPEQELDIVKRQALYEKLIRLASSINSDEVMEKVRLIEPILLGNDERARQMARLVQFVNSGEIEAAKPLLEATQNEAEPTWLQCRAMIAAQSGKPAEALADLQRVIGHYPHPHLLRHTAEIAVQAGDVSEAVSLFERYLQRRPEDFVVRRHLALLYAQQSDFPGAIKHFALLRNGGPGDVADAMNYAAALAQAGELEKGLTVYQEICARPDPPLNAVLACSSLLKALGRPDMAFNSLIDFRERFWEEPAYLMAVSEIGYAAQQEQVAMEALQQVQRLQAEGKADPNLVRLFPVEDVATMMADHHQREKELLEPVTRGRVPWLIVDHLRNRTSLGAWHERTQPLVWAAEYPFIEAKSAIYATNSFFIDRRRDSARPFHRIPVPHKGAPIVADISALITLHQLKKLSLAAEFFGEIHIPSIYMPLALEEAGKLVLHQPSRKMEMEGIRDAIDAKRISVVAEIDSSQARLSDVDDSRYDEATITVRYVPRDALVLLREHGFISDQQLLDHSHLCRHVSLASRPLELEQALVVDLNLLGTLASTNLLEPLLQAFRVQITESDRDTVIASLRSYKQQQEIYQSHRDLWENVRSDSRFVKVAHAPRKRSSGDDEDNDLRKDTGIAAALLAQQEGLPLLADDRVCQSFIYYDPKSPAGCFAFGTDRFLVACGEQGVVLTADDVATAFLQLIRWRYRFLIPPASVLKTLASRHRSDPPGRDIHEVALYIHDCMRDAGIPLEQASEQPTSALGNWIFLQWTQTVLEFVGLLWADKGIEMERAERYTVWAVHEMLPSPARVLGAAAVFADQRLPQHLLSHTLLGLIGTAENPRARKALDAICAALGISKNQYTRMVSEVLRGL